MVNLRIVVRRLNCSMQEAEIVYEICHKEYTRSVASGHIIYYDEWDWCESRVKIDVGDNARCGYLQLIINSIAKDMALLRHIVSMSSEHGDTDYSHLLEIYRKQTTVLEFMRETIKHKREIGKSRTAETYQATLNSFGLFLHNDDVLFEDMNFELICSYEAFLREKRVSLNTSSFYMRNLRSIYNRAVERGIAEQHNPFRGVYTGVCKTQKRAIGLNEIRRIIALNLVHDSMLELTRDIFLFSLYARGMSFVDIAYLEISDIENGVLSYTRRKTGRRLHIRLERCMQDIICKYYSSGSAYIFPLLDEHADNIRRSYLNMLHMVNRKLKVIGSMAKIDANLSMHVARHTWASLAKRINIPISVISDGLGHDSEKTTLIYISSINNNLIDNANRAIISQILK
ncbi:MAG: site-specific integrase [Alistipes sp.]|nr:site-specific integrase [Alistipes sp.]